MKKRFLFTLVFTIIISSLFCGAFFELLSAGLRNAHKDFQGKLNYLIRGKERYNVVFIGSSVVNNQINPILFDSLENVNSYNAGTEGARIVELEVFLKKFINSHGAPKYLFISLDETTLITDHIWDFPRLFPYSSDNDIFRLYAYQREILLARYFPSMALTFYDDSRKSLALQSLAGNSKPFIPDYTKGYHPLAKKPLANMEGSSFEKYHFSADGIKALTNICEFCKNKNSKLIFLIPPKLITTELVGANSDSYSKIAEIARTYNLPLIDLSHNKEFTDPNLFYDERHLIEPGANIYTRLIAEEFEKLH